jgi:hypothetical protein
MRSGLVDQRDRGPAALAEFVTQAGGEFQAAGTTTDDHDLVQAVRRRARRRVTGSRAHWTTFVLRTPVFALGAARRAHGVSVALP